ncbi:hypothetical protein [Sphingobium lignivorans]|uniref:Methyltransferase n=1 Tax=Sphingobium lignivorans TaxID=2735886 RepID=A0ABR6NDI4_9SPHN|nr:hypothetical protein [Sphingobium lignivorans]MBB5985338.1 hypothetical protein [Sphingobium lignivorans]
MSAELSSGVTRRRNGSADEKTPRHPWDWYVEQEWVTERLLDEAPVDHDVMVLDPCCGGGNIVRALRGRSVAAFGMDLFDRGAPHFLGCNDFIGPQRTVMEAGPLSIVFNPPFSCQDGRIVRGLAERFVRRALEIATHQVAALLPLKWLASEGRCRLFTQQTPAGVWILAERPSMPPGDMIDEMGEDAFSRGKVDYMWVLWDNRLRPHLDDRGRPYAPTFWIPPRGKVA